MSTTTCIRLRTPEQHPVIRDLRSLLRVPLRWIEEKACWLQWQRTHDRRERELLFERLLSTYPSPDSLLHYWSEYAHCNIRQWLRGEPFPQAGQWHWGPFARAIRMDLHEALLVPLCAIAESSTERTSLRVRAIRALGQLKHARGQATLVLLAGCKIPVICQAASVAILNGLDDMAVLAPELLRTLTMGHREDRCTAARAIGNLGVVTPEILHALVVMLRDRNQATMQVAGRALSELGYRAEPALLELRDLAQDDWVEDINRKEARKVFSQINCATADKMTNSMSHELERRFFFLRLKRARQNDTTGGLRIGTD